MNIYTTNVSPSNNSLEALTTISESISWLLSTIDEDNFPSEREATNEDISPASAKRETSGISTRQGVMVFRTRTTRSLESR